MFSSRIKAKYKVEDKEADAAPPTPAMKKGNYYHGTTTKRNADKIWQEGIKPDLSDTPDYNISKPVAGRVYCTKNIGYALIYALGGDIAGNKKPLFVDDFGRFGYVFVIPGAQFKEIHPDEDEVGKAIHDKKLPWLTKIANDLLKNEEPADEEACGYDSLLREIELGCYTCWIKAGKLLLPHLTDKQKLDIIKKYGNVAHEGILHPTEMWQIDRNLIPKLTKDGSNFFQVAKKIKGR